MILTTVEQVYLQQAGQEPICVESRYSEAIQTEEQPWIRRKLIKEEWQPLDTGWVNPPGVVCLKNEATKRQVNPTPEETQEDAQKILVLAIEADDNTIFTEISPGTSCRLKLVRVPFIRCLRGQTHMSLLCCPR